MYNYSTTTLNFYTKDNLIIDSLLENAIYPNAVLYGNVGVFIGFLLKGTFNTKKQVDFLNDVIARFFITYNLQQVQLENKLPLISNNFQELKSISQSSQLLSLTNIKNYSFKQNFDKEVDKVFWALKIWAIDYIRANKVLNYQEFETFGMNNFIGGKKSKSDIRCKCRSIFNYYLERDFEIEKTIRTRKTKNNEELTMTRKENLENYKKELETKNYKKVVTILSSLFACEYKKPSGGWNMLKLQQETNLSQPTLRKCIKNYESLLVK